MRYISVWNRGRSANTAASPLPYLSNISVFLTDSTTIETGVCGRLSCVYKNGTYGYAKLTEAPKSVPSGRRPPLPPRKTKRRADGSRLREASRDEDPCTDEGMLAKGILKEMLRHKSLLNVSDYILSTVSIPSNESPC